MSIKRRFAVVVMAASIMVSGSTGIISDQTYVNAASVETVTETKLSDSQYQEKVNKFLADSRFKNGVSWSASKKPILSTYGATGCCAYTCDFAKYVFKKNSYNSGTKFTNVNAIKAGDILHFTNSSHWICVIKRTNNSLKVAEGNWGGKVVVSNGKYTIKNGKIYRSGSKFRTFSAGYHMR